MPRVARVARGAAQPVVERDFVAAAEAMGVSRPRILLGEMLPNILWPADGGGEPAADVLDRPDRGARLPRASRPTPNGANWGTMIQENQLALVSQPWGVVLPIIAIALLTIGTGLVGDGIARAAAGIDRGGRRVSTADAEPVAVEDLRIVLRDTEIDIVDEVSFSDRARRGARASSASPAPARPPSASPCSVTRGAAREIAGGAIRSATSTSSRSRAPGGARVRGRARLVRAAGPGGLAQPGAADRQAAARGARGARLRLGLARSAPRGSRR